MSEKTIGVSSLQEVLRFAQEVRNSKWKVHQKDGTFSFISLRDMDRVYLQKCLSLLRKEATKSPRRCYWEWRISFELQYRIHMGERVVEEYKEALPVLKNADEIKVSTTAETTEATTA